MSNIIQDGHPTLRTVASPVPKDEITSPKIAGVIAEMKDALAHEPHGVALAAPQINKPLRIFTVSGKIFAPPSKDGKQTPPPPDLVFINPKLEKLSGQKKLVDEGCLSVRTKQGKIERAEGATISAYNERGEQFTMEVTGLLAQIFQHEVDHLDGILFTDKAVELEKIPEKTTGL